ncbi:MAG: NUDIX hydrolase [Clostridia bacterium]|nr:NUDIX hydrolase [Clostridia bacterium]
MNSAQLEDIFHQVNRQFGQKGIFRPVRLTFSSKKFFEEFKKQVQIDRWGEVAFAVERKNGKFIVIRAASYPDGIYRIPTGGIQFGEQVSHALFREIQEELGLKVELVQFLGAVGYDICYEKERLPYISFVFHLKETGGTILKDATQHEICEYLEADKKALTDICRRMEEHCASWQDWCSFRRQTTSFLLPFLD